MARRPRTAEAGAGDVYLTEELEKELVDRLARIEGHVRGVRRMLEERRDCDDILTQVAGVKAAVEQVAIRLLQGHLETCVAQAIRAGDAQAVARFQESLDRVVR